MKTKTVKVNLGKRSYDVVIGRDLGKVLTSFLKKNFRDSNVLIVTDWKIARLHMRGLVKAVRAAQLRSGVHVVPVGERSKSERELFNIYRSLIRTRCDRSSLIIALGGGVVGDLAGFAAATYMRGISFINCPTTLLAQVDSAIGGKTGIDLPEGKNLVGAFHQPSLVCADSLYLRTLPQSEFLNGLAEVIKYGILGDAKFFAYLEKNIERVLDRDPLVLNCIVETCVRIKSRIVEKDEREASGLRAVLNLGHTFAHGLEGAARYRKITHAQAVAIGLIAAGELAHRKGTFSRSDHDRVIGLIERSTLPVKLRKFSLKPRHVIKFMKRDKKARGGKLVFVLPTRIGQVRLTDRVLLDEVEQVLDDVW